MIQTRHLFFRRNWI